MSKRGSIIPAIPIYVDCITAGAVPIAILVIVILPGRGVKAACKGRTAVIAIAAQADIRLESFLLFFRFWFELKIGTGSVSGGQGEGAGSLGADAAGRAEGKLSDWVRE